MVFFKHLRDILILPFTVTVIVPYFVYHRNGPPNPEFTILTSVLGLMVGILGFSLFIYTVKLFATIGKGTLAPWSPKENLVVAGPYRFCRNPMITGVFFILLGETIFFLSTEILEWAIIFFFINTLYFFLKEEPDLDRKFGEEYRIYKKNVPRWIPRLRAWDGSQ